MAAASALLPAFSVSIKFVGAGEPRMLPGIVRDVTLVLGGVRSGKSRYALKLAAHAKRVIFLATAEPREDAEMRRKIEKHRAERPEHWVTIEEPLNLPGAITSATDCDLMVVDCLTLYAAKLLEAYEGNAAAIGHSIDGLCSALMSSQLSVVLVSNEVGSGVVPAFELGRQYRDLLGEMNQRVAAIADSVVLMVAGLPLVLKGSPDSCE
jgi:adenosylcobinamide kinase / adenosylcobinamide-phosphate guanylyltransferase